MLFGLQRVRRGLPGFVEGLEHEAQGAGRVGPLDQVAQVERVPGRLARLGLDEDGARKADSVRLLDHPVHEAAYRVQRRADAPVQQGLVAFTPAPQHVVLAAELAGGI